MTDTYHRRGAPGHHKGGPRRQLSIEAGAPVKYPNMRRPPGRTLAQALHTNAHLEENPMMAGRVEEVMPTRTGRQAPLVAGPRRVRRPR